MDALCAYTCMIQSYVSLLCENTLCTHVYTMHLTDENVILCARSYVMMGKCKAMLTWQLLSWQLLTWRLLTWQVRGGEHVLGHAHLASLQRTASFLARASGEKNRGKGGERYHLPPYIALSGASDFWIQVLDLKYPGFGSQVSLFGVPGFRALGFEFSGADSRVLGSGSGRRPEFRSSHPRGLLFRLAAIRVHTRGIQPCHLSSATRADVLPPSPGTGGKHLLVV